MKKYAVRGQVLLITVLVLSIAVTIALSLIGRSVADISMSRNLEESARAFSAAEAGLEAALQGTLTDAQEGFVPYADRVSYQSSSTIIGGTTGAYTLPSTSPGLVGSVWLVGHTIDNAIDEAQYYTGTSLDICWTPPGAGQPIPAIEVVLYYKSGGLYLVERGAYDPDITRRSENAFSSVSEINGSCGTVTNVYKQSIVLPGGIPLLVRIRPFYGSTTVTVAPVGTDILLPRQGVEITSTGKTDGGVTRKIVVKRQYPWPASIFDYSVYSQDSFLH
ncbi:MAG: hypothetical protein V1917_03015 [Candidatus Gottesmanbacteria bacterium]